MTVDLNDGGSAEITADRFVLAAGGRPVIPDIPGLDEDVIGRGVVHTSDTIMRIDELPRAAGGRRRRLHRGRVRPRLRLVRHPRSPSWCAGPGCCGTTTPTSPTTFTHYTQHRYDLRRDTDVCGIKPTTAGGDGVTVFVEGPYGEATDRRRHDAAGDRPAAELRPAEPAGHRRDDRTPQRPGRRRRVPGDRGPRHLRAGRHQLAVRAQARRQPRGPGGAAQPDAPGRPGHAPITGSCRPRCSPNRRSPPSD